MRNLFSTTLTALALIAIPTFAQEAPPIPAAPTGTLLQAEADPSAENATLIDDVGAMGTQAVALRGDWNRIMVPVPPGEAFRVWVRYKNGPMALKGTGGGEQKELKWNFDSPKDWAWTDFGTYERGELGDNIVLMREKQNDKPDPTVDAIVFAPDVVRPLPPFAPDAAAAPLAVKASVNWDESAGRLAPELWGVNDYEVLTPEKAADAGLGEFLRQTHFPMIRIHEGGFSDRWTRAETRGWDVEKIRAGFAGSSGYGDAKIMLNIARWPGWLQQGDYLPPEKTEEFVQLVGQLVTILRDAKRPIAYWELLNEKEAAYEKLGKMDELYDLYNRLAREVKRRDPNARVGGPAMSWPNPVWVEGFLRNCAQNADFITYHNYGSGEIYDSNEALFTKPAAFARSAETVREAVNKYAPDRPFETFLTEYNVKWTWTPFERRHANNVGAVFMASTLNHLSKTSVNGVMHWHLKGYYYGMIDDENVPRPAARLYSWGTHYLIGDIARSDSDNELLELLPITRADGARSVLLTNKAAQTVSAPAAATLLPCRAGEAAWMERLDATNFNSPGANASGAIAPGALMLPGYSVTLLSVAPK